MRDRTKYKKKLEIPPIHRYTIDTESPSTNTHSLGLTDRIVFFSSSSLYIWLFHMFGRRERTVQQILQAQSNARTHCHRRWNVFFEIYTLAYSSAHKYTYTRFIYISISCVLCVFALFLTIIVHRHRRISSRYVHFSYMQQRQAQLGSTIDLSTVLLSVSSWSWVSWEQCRACTFHINIQ